MRSSTMSNHGYATRLSGLAVAAVVLGGCTAPSPSAEPQPSSSAPGTTSQTSPSPSSSGAIDSCLVGTWREVSNESDLDLSGAGGAKARVQGAGRTLTFHPDGTELVDYGDGVTQSGRSADGVVVERTTTGTVEYRVSSREGTLSFTLITDDTQIVYRSGGRVVSEGRFGQSAPVSYTCGGDTHTQSQGSGYQAEYRRS